MADERLARVDLTKLYQPFRAKIEQLVVNCEKLGSRYYATSGVRTFEEQAKLYAIGRTTGTLGHFVTKAKPGQSPHNFGFAVDFSKDNDASKPGLQPDYNEASYDTLAKEAVKLNLESGRYWKSIKDSPHVQLPFKAKGLTLAMLNEAYVSGGYPAIFALLDKFGPW